MRAAACTTTSIRSKAASTSRRTLGSSLREVHRGSGAHDGRGPSPSPSKTRSQTASPSWRINEETQAVTASQIRGDAPCEASAKAYPDIAAATGPIRSSKSRRCARLWGSAPHRGEVPRCPVLLLPPRGKALSPTTAIHVALGAARRAAAAEATPVVCCGRGSGLRPRALRARWC